MNKEKKLKYELRLFWYYIETRYVKLLRYFKIRRSISCIPEGQYCYVWDEERNINEPIKNGYWTKTCKYYKHSPYRGGVACTYTGFFGFDFLLYDQCKICGVNDEINECDLT